MATGAEAISFRQVGKKPQGNVFRGGLCGQRSGITNTASIPSKFETTLFTGSKEKNAFGSRSYRFSEHENDLPGPGAYEETARFRDDRIYSKKGLGVGFASQAKRAADLAPKGQQSVPGPGNYEARNATLAQSARRSGGSSSAFKPPSMRSVTVADEPMPGPGHYERKGTLGAGGPTIGPKPAEPTALRPGAPRTVRYTDRAPMRNAMPAPGQYEPKAGNAAHADAALPTAAFRSTVPIGGDKGARRATREQQLGVVEVAAERRPGPGEYDGFSSSFAHSRRRSPQFCDSALDRFGRVAAPRHATAPSLTPGPGAYYREPVREVAPISSSVFMSGSKRAQPAVATGQPGPAFYKPDDGAGKRSFHLNVVQRFMPS